MGVFFDSGIYWVGGKYFFGGVGGDKLQKIALKYLLLSSRPYTSDTLKIQQVLSKCLFFSFTKCPSLFRYEENTVHVCVRERRRCGCSKQFSLLFYRLASYEAKTLCLLSIYFTWSAHCECVWKGGEWLYPDLEKISSLNM